MAQNDTTTADRKQYQKNLMEFIGCRPVAYWPLLARRVGGVKAAVMLSQLLYWHGDSKIQKRDGWILKTTLEMEDETGLTKVEQQTARKTLLKLGVIEAELRGIPRIWYYRILVDPLGDILTQWESHPTVTPSNEKASQHWEGKSPSLGENPSQHWEGKSPSLGENPSQLNKVLKTTDKNTGEITGENTEIQGPSPNGLSALNIWQMVTGQLVSDLRTVDYNTYIPSLRAEGIVENKFIISGINSYSLAYVESRMGQRIQKLITSLCGQDMEIVFQLREVQE